MGKNCIKLDELVAPPLCRGSLAERFFGSMEFDGGEGVINVCASGESRSLYFRHVFTRFYHFSRYFQFYFLPVSPFNFCNPVNRLNTWYLCDFVISFFHFLLYSD